MVICNSWAISIFFFLIIPCAFPLHFNLPSIGTNESSRINIEGGAYFSPTEGIQVTQAESGVPMGNKTGRAIWKEPLHLWDKASGNLTDFNTHFSFIIDSSGSEKSGDGLAFFLAPVGSSIPNDAGGNGLGLASTSNLSTNSSANQFVAVEFDTCPGSWEWNLYGSDPHVGININSMNSVTTTRWCNNVSLGTENDAWISYSSISQNLSVVITGFTNNKTQQNSLSYVVDLSKVLPDWVIFGFSAATEPYFEKHAVKSWEFYSSLPENVTYPTDPGAAAPSPNHEPVVVSKEKNERNIGLVVGLTIGLSVLVGGLVLIGSCLLKKRNTEEKEDEFALDLSMDDEFEKGSGPKKFSYDELVRATNSFAEEAKLGEGGFGGVYRGFLRDLNSHVAVKRVSRGSKQGIKEYASEVKIFSRLRHRNLVQLIGWCHEKRELLLVYEFMPNGSLDSHLFKAKTKLTWVVRYKIAQGLASALLYLHDEWEQCVVHRDIKSSNIMLDSRFNAKLGDFGLARLVDHEKGSQTTIVAGTMGYMAPECIITDKASKESDVYSFGIVALEIACGRKPIFSQDQESQIRLVEWVWDLYGMGKLLEAADPKLCVDFDKQEMERLMIVGLWCAHPDNSLQPPIRQAIHVLSFEASLPTLPSQMPLPTYSAPPLHMSYSYGANDSEGGIAFFLASENSLAIPSNSGAGWLGLFNETNNGDLSNQIVAVEFDTFQDQWDPSNNHVGIDVNSVVSMANLTWTNTMVSGDTLGARVSYNATSKNLNVFLKDPDVPNDVGSLNLTLNVELRDFLPEKVIVGFSASTGQAFPIQAIMLWNFTSTLDPVVSGGNSKKWVVWLIIGIVALVVGTVLIWAVLWRIERNKKLKEEDYEDEEMGMEDSIDEDLVKETGPKRFTYKELVVATNNFSEEGKLGQGGFGSVYRGFLADLNMEIAVKKISSSSKQGKKEYISEVKIISHLRHRNLVQLVGWSHERGSFILVYEYMPNGSLDSHLFGKKTPLTWPLRHRIAHGLASGLLYLHEEWEQCVVHRDIKSSNVMLDSNFNAKLGDFGLARLVDHGLSSATTVLAGTMGYMAPECVTMTSKASKESDVFSFGVVALEIACGRKAVEPSAEESKVSLVSWVWDLYGRGRLLEAADETLNGEFDKEEMICLMTVGLWCAHPDHNLRPTIRQAIQVLNFEVPLPSLPSQMPVPMYFAPAATLSSQLEYTWSTQATCQTTTTSATSNESTLSRVPSTKSLL
ncbi:hypothetical protein F0562_020866 [Nyssa sinensis]|uniref:non-specific serine/threonine protein kinase n=1 Tax=Nyssa sinensis TaxID=561372 RepID=A0A5J5BR67_9ASTE|nr:hypothetical protein F0562_020866 [Nyssa sinensis]